MSKRLCITSLIGPIPPGNSEFSRRGPMGLAVLAKAEAGALSITFWGLFASDWCFISFQLLKADQVEGVAPLESLEGCSGALRKAAKVSGEERVLGALLDEVVAGEEDDQ